MPSGTRRPIGDQETNGHSRNGNHPWALTE